MTLLWELGVFKDSLVSGPGFTSFGSGYIPTSNSGSSESMATLTVTGVAETDPRWADVVFCINASGASGSTVITDAKGLPVSRIGDVQIDTALGYPTIKFDGTDDLLSLGNSADTRFESGVFTFDTWIYFDRAGARQGIFGNRHASLVKGGAVVTQTNNTLTLYFVGGSALSTTATIGVGLYHLEVSVDASRVGRIFIDGVLRASGTVNVGTASTDPLYIGVEDGAYSGDLKARIRSMRLTRGATVRHTVDFTPPTAPFPTQ